jgi:hypothetical protein
MATMYLRIGNKIYAHGKAPCILFQNDVEIGRFDSKAAAGRYCAEKFGISGRTFASTGFNKKNGLCLKLEVEEQ